MTIPELLFGIGLGLVFVALFAYILSANLRWLGVFLLLTGTFVIHDGFGNRLLPPPNDAAVLTMVLLGVLLCTLGMSFLGQPDVWKSK